MATSRAQPSSTCREVRAWAVSGRSRCLSRRRRISSPSYLQRRHHVLISCPSSRPSTAGCHTRERAPKVTSSTSIRRRKQSSYLKPLSANSSSRRDHYRPHRDSISGRPGHSHPRHLHLLILEYGSRATTRARIFRFRKLSSLMRI